MSDSWNSPRRTSENSVQAKFAVSTSYEVGSISPVLVRWGATSTSSLPYDASVARKRAKGEAMRNEGIFVGPADGKDLTNPIGGAMVIKVRDEHTDGAYSVHDNTIPPGSSGPRPHLHRRHDEAFYVLDGELTVRVGSRKLVAPAGSFVVVPRGVVHQPSNPGTEPTRVLLVFSPAGMDHFFEEAADRRLPLQAVPDDPVVLERLEAFTEKYGYEFAEFPQGTLGP